MEWMSSPCEVAVYENSAYILKEQGNIIKLEMTDYNKFIVSEVAKLV